MSEASERNWNQEMEGPVQLVTELICLFLFLFLHLWFTLCSANQPPSMVASLSGG